MAVQYSSYPGALQNLIALCVFFHIDVRTLLMVGKPNYFDCTVTINVYECIYRQYAKLLTI